MGNREALEPGGSGSWKELGEVRGGESLRAEVGLHQPPWPRSAGHAPGTAVWTDNSRAQPGLIGGSCMCRPNMDADLLPTNNDEALRGFKGGDMILSVFLGGPCAGSMESALQGTWPWSGRLQVATVLSRGSCW